MATHPGMLVAYDDAGNIIHTLDFLTIQDDEGHVIGVADFAAHEEAGGENTEIWTVETELPDGSVVPAKGSKVWPEYLGTHAHGFRVELVGPPGKKTIGALVHKTSGHRRERAAVEAAIAGRIRDAAGQPADIRDLVGGPDRPIHIDENGRNRARGVTPQPKVPMRRRHQ